MVQEILPVSDDDNNLGIVFPFLDLTVFALVGIGLEGKLDPLIRS